MADPRWSSPNTSGSDISVSLEADPAENASLSSVNDERKVSGESTSGEISAAGEADSHSSSSSSSNQQNTLANLRQNHSLSVLVTKLFDKKIPFKNKLKWLNRVATIKDDGTVQFDVPGDIKPQSLGFGTGVVYDGTVDDERHDAEVEGTHIPPLQIVVLIVGTRGDVQPFIAIGKRLQEDGHRVRLATHANFKEFVLTAGLEFFPFCVYDHNLFPGTFPAHMVKNKGFLPSGPSEISIQRNQIKEIIFSLLPACERPDPDTKIPFKAEAIIANPPAYG